MWRKILEDSRSLLVVQRFATMASLFVLVAVLVQPTDAAVVLRGFFGLAGMVLALTAWWNQEAVNQPNLTPWDEAAAFLLLHHGFGMLGTRA